VGLQEVALVEVLQEELAEEMAAVLLEGEQEEVLQVAQEVVMEEALLEEEPAEALLVALVEVMVEEQQAEALVAVLLEDLEGATVEDLLAAVQEVVLLVGMLDKEDLLEEVSGVRVPSTSTSISTLTPT
jgi:hypothetical protein